MDDEDWEHVSEEAKMLVKRLLEKDPTKRCDLDDVLTLSWKIQSVASASAMKAHKNLKKTVLKRKLHRVSMGVFEKNSKHMNQIYSVDDNNTSPTTRGHSYSVSNHQFCVFYAFALSLVFFFFFFSYCNVLSIHVFLRLACLCVKTWGKKMKKK